MDSRPKRIHVAQRDRMPGESCCHGATQMMHTVHSARGHSQTDTIICPSATGIHRRIHNMPEKAGAMQN
jgi:hypothetical protein